MARPKKDKNKVNPAKVDELAKKADKLLAEGKEIDANIPPESALSADEIRDTEEVPISVNLPDKMLRVGEVAAYLDCSESSIYTLIQHGRLIAEKYNGMIRVSKESVTAFRMKSQMKPLD